MREVLAVGIHEQPYSTPVPRTHGDSPECAPSHSCRDRLATLDLVNTGSHAGYWWLMSIILTTQEAGIRKILVQSQPWGK
jgi:hypothetical protein